MCTFRDTQSAAAGGQPMKILDAPIHLGSLAAESEKSTEDTHKNIWLVKKGDDSSVRIAYYPIAVM